MRQKLICCGLAAWLLFLQAYPAFAAESAPDNGGADSPAQEELAASEGGDSGDTEEEEEAPPDGIAGNIGMSVSPFAPVNSGAHITPNADGPPAFFIDGVSAELEDSHISSASVREAQLHPIPPTGQHEAEAEDEASLKAETPTDAETPPPAKPPLWPDNIQPPPEKAAVFEDVPSTHYAFQSVSWAVSNGITNGTSPKTFSPDNPCTHWHILTFLWRICGSPTDDGVTESPFEDVGLSGDRIHVAIWAKENGLRTGEGGKFNGNDRCTRSEAMRYLWLLSGAPLSRQECAFTDVSADADYAMAVAWAVEMGVTKGTSETTFSPDNPCTRAHIVTFLYKSWTAAQSEAS